jgi:cob(I)alamin adenosyltransferase
MAIYTKTGDKGETSLANGERISKADARIEAYGTVDELNSWIGALRAEVCKPTSDLSRKGKEIDEQLQWMQNKLFNLGAALSLAPGEWVTAADVRQIEQWIDAMQAVVPKQHAFLLPAGNETVCRCHIARTVCRRAERRMIEAGGVGIPVQFINRLSDYLFVLARLIGYTTGTPDETWKKDFFVEKLTEK